MMLSDYQRRKCLEALDVVQNYNISKMFDQPVDPIRDECLNYLEIILHPMDLGTIRKKLMSNEYETVDDFKNDVDLVWENAILYNGKTALISNLAKQLQSIFNEYACYVTGNDASDWTNECTKIKIQLEGMFISSKAQPPPPLPQPEKKSLPSRQKRQVIDPDLISTDSVPITSHRHKGRNNKGRQKVSISHVVSDEQSPPPLPPPPPPPPPPEIPKEKCITEEEKKLMAEEINNISNNDDLIQQLIDIIQAREPSYVNQDGEVECNIDQLQDSTLIIFRRILREFKTNV